MTPVQSTPATQRHERLAAFLREDPANPALLADACEAAIACGAHERADAYIASAQALALDGSEWSFRRARLAIARGDLAQAAQLLQALLDTSGPHPVLAHDLAYVRLLQGEFAAARALLQPWVEAGPLTGLPPAQQQPLQALWLRCLHRLQLLDEAMEWARPQQEQGALAPAAQGVAGLIAVDLEDFQTALRLADAALAADPAQLEALVARASVALAQGQPALAGQLLQRALARHPDDGRAWSVLGFASLQAMDLPLARKQLERAVQHMPDHVDTWQALGWTRMLQGDPQGAVAALRKALELDEESAESHGAMGLVLAMTGAAEMARTHLETAERLDPGNAASRYARVLLSGAARDPQAIEAITRQLLEARAPFGGRMGDLVRKPGSERG